MKKFILILFILVGFNLNAALAPLYQSIKEIEHVLKDESLKEQLSSGDAVLEVKRVENLDANSINTMELNLANLPEGVYLLKISSENGIYTKKITLTR